MLYFLVSLLFISCNRPNGEETKPTEGRMTVYADRNIADLVTQKILWKKNYNKPQQLQFFPETNRLVFLQND